jgi:hypothetical protein
MGVDESGLDKLARLGFCHPRPADLTHRRAQGVTGLDHPKGEKCRRRPSGHAVTAGDHV